MKSRQARARGGQRVVRSAAKLGLASALWVLLLLPSPAAASSWPLWDAYKAYFCDAQGRIVDYGANDRTTSEAQAYALFFSLVANDHARFDRILHWTEANLASGDLRTHLPGWRWGRAPDGAWRLLDGNSASDADLWMCYTLLQAARLWKEPRYGALGRAMAGQIAATEITEVPDLGPMLLPAPHGFRRGPVFDCNPSYLAPQLMMGIAASGVRGPWSALARNAIHILKASARKGFAFDWVAFRPGAGFSPVAAGPAKAPDGSFDAIRVYLWAGTLAARSIGRGALLETFRPVARYVREHGVPPASVNAEGRPRGEGNIGFSAAVVPLLEGLHDKATAQAQRVRYGAALNPATGLYGNPPRYYEENLIMFSQGWSSRRYRFDAQGTLSVAWR